MYSTFLLFCIAACLLSSCATLFSGKEQTVKISIPTKAAKLTIDSAYIAAGTDFAPSVVKDNQVKQLIFDAEGHKRTYRAIVPDDLSNWTYLSTYPFALVLFIPPIVDILSPNAWQYKDEYVFPPLRKYTYSDTTLKQLYMNNVAFDISTKNNIFRIYTYDAFLANTNMELEYHNDSIGTRYTGLDTKLSLLLKKLNYTDTTNTVFIDNINSIYLDARVTRIVVRGVRFPKMMPIFTLRMADAEVTSQWMAKSIYGDTLYTSTIVSKSGQFPIKQNVLREAERLSIEDALEYSLLDFIDTLSTAGVVKSEHLSTDFNEVIRIAKPTKPPVNIGDAMKASVTIKNADGHGSGLLISHDGYIVTNHHVVNKGGDYTVILNDGTEYKGKVLRTNKIVDLALVKIEGMFDAAYSLPSQQNYKIGDEAWAIGTPQSILLGQTVSKGIVSGSRKHNGRNLLQSDISLNRGNSGGPILLKNGELIAIVEYKLYGKGTEGISFSIPAFEVMKSLGLSY